MAASHSTWKSASRQQISKLKKTKPTASKKKPNVTLTAEGFKSLVAFYAGVEKAVLEIRDLSMTLYALRHALASGDCGEVYWPDDLKHYTTLDDAVSDSLCNVLSRIKNIDSEYEALEMSDMAFHGELEQNLREKGFIVERAAKSKEDTANPAPCPIHA